MNLEQIINDHCLEENDEDLTKELREFEAGHQQIITALESTTAKLVRAMLALENLETIFKHSCVESHGKAERQEDKQGWTNGYYQGNASAFKLASQWVREAIDFDVNKAIRVQTTEEVIAEVSALMEEKDPEARCPKCGNRNRLCQC